MTNLSPNSKVKKPTVPEVAPLVAEYYQSHGTGGSLHLVLDDSNVDDSNVLYCLKMAQENNDSLGVKIANLLLKMSKTQRLKLGKVVRDMPASTPISCHNIDPC